MMTADRGSPKFHVRAAKADDYQVFLTLARLCVAESGRSLREADAREVFAGNARADLAVHLLFAGDAGEPIGFSIVRGFVAPLTRVASIRQELVFVRDDWRSCEAEGFLHAMAIFEFESLPVHEISLYVQASPYAREVIQELRRIGFRDAGLRMEGGRKRAEDLRHAGIQPC